MRSRGEGSIIKRGDRYSVVLDLGEDGTGKRRRKWLSGYKTKREAEKALREALTRHEQGVTIAPAKQRFGLYLTEHWLPSIEPNLRPSTFASYSAMVHTHLVQRLGDVELRRLTPTHFTVMYAELLATGRLDGKGGLSRRTVRYLHTIAGRALRDAVRWHLIVRSPLDGVTPPAPGQREMAVWTRDDAARFLAFVASDRLAALYRLALATGLRRGELLGLRWSDVDLEAGQLAVRQSLVSVQYKLVMSEPKTPRSRRVIALDGATVATLRPWRARQATERLACGAVWRDTGLIFTREDGGPIHPQALSGLFDRRVKAAGVPRITLHGLRHTSATLGLSAGVPLKIMSGRLGHSSMALTGDVYTHFLVDLDQDAADALGAALDSGGK